MTRNFILFDNATLFSYSVAYVDVSKNLAIELLKKNNVKANVEDIGTADGIRYNVVIAKVRKRDIARFMKAMSELFEEIMSSGYTDYEEFCRKICYMADNCAA